MPRLAFLRTATGIFLAGVAHPAVAQQVATLDSPDSAIVITSARAAKTARAEQKLAPNLVNIQSAETIAKYPDYNAAEALGRVPGVSLSIDTGEGRFVNIRGLDGNLNGATFGGVVLLNTQAGGTYFNASGRAVEFDTVPIGAVDRIVVTKTGLPDHEAEGLGGTVELTPRTAIGRDQPFIDLQLGAGYQPLRKTGLYKVDATFGGGFARNAEGNTLFHGVVNLFKHDDKRGIDDVEESYSDNQSLGIPDKAFSSLELRRYIYNRRRFGATGEFDITPSDTQRLFIRASVAGYVERVNRQRLEIDGLDGTNGSGIIAAAPGNPNGFFVPDASAVKTLRDEEETHRNVILQIGGEHRFSAAKFDWFAALARSTYDKHYDRNTTFAWSGNPTGVFPVNYDNTTDPNYPVFSTGSVNLADPNAYVLDNIRNQIEYDRDLEHSFAANLSFPLNLVPGDELKFGGKLRFRHKFEEVGSVRFGGAGQPLTQFDTGDSIIYYHGHYNIGPFIDRSGIVGAFGPQIAVPPLGRSDISFDDHEDVSGGYAQYKATIGKLGVLAGARIEHTKASYGGWVDVVKDTTGNTTHEFDILRKNYTNIFPTVQLRYEFTPQLVARATYSTALARPGFLQTIQKGQVNFGNQVVTTGNPNLRPTYGHNFDLSLEHYLPDSGIISVGVFDKQFKDYIIARTFHAPYPGSTNSFLYQSFDNVSGAYARGVEASFVDHLRWLPAPFDGVGIDSNVTYVKSAVFLHDNEPRRLLPGTSPWTGNLALTYEKGPIELRLAGEYVGHTLFGVGGSTATDVYQEARATLDFYADYNVSRSLSLYFTAKNLLDTPLKFYEREPGRPIQREFYLQTYEAGVKIRI